MKPLFFLFVATLFVTSCAPCDCEIGEANVETVKSIYSAFAEGNIDGVVASLSPEVTWNEAENYIYADGNPYVGPDAIIQGVFARIGADWEYFNLENKEFKPAGGSHVLVTGRYQAKHNASGNTIDAQFAHVWTVQGGKIVQFQQYTDTKQAAEAVIVAAADTEGEEE